MNLTGVDLTLRRKPDEEIPHPDAARLCIEFVLSKEGQEKLRDEGRIPARTDVTRKPFELHNKDWKVEVVGLEEDIAKIRKVYAEIFELPAG